MPVENVSDPTTPVLPDWLTERGWERVEESVETVFELPALRVRGGTVRYEDVRSHEALAAAGEQLDGPVRFVAGTQLAFEPSLPPWVTPSMVAPTLRTEARKSFERRLRERGLRAVERRRSERIRVAGRRRARLTKFTATRPLEEGELPLVCWLAVWTTTDNGLVVTGGYPDRMLAEQFEIDDGTDVLRTAPTAYREAFLDVLKAVEPSS